MEAHWSNSRYIAAPAVDAFPDLACLADKAAEMGVDHWSGNGPMGYHGDRCFSSLSCRSDEPILDGFGGDASHATGSDFFTPP